MLPQMLRLRPFLCFRSVLELKKPVKSQMFRTKKQLLQAPSLSSEEKGVRQLHQPGDWYMTGRAGGCTWYFSFLLTGYHLP